MRSGLIARHSARAYSRSSPRMSRPSSGGVNAARSVAVSGASRKDMRRNGNVSRCILPSGRRISIRRRRFSHLSGLSILAENSLFSSGEYYTKNTCLSAPISGLRNNRANTAMYRHAESSRSRFDNATFPRTKERNQHSFLRSRKHSHISSSVQGNIIVFLPSFKETFTCARLQSRR